MKTKTFNSIAYLVKTARVRESLSQETLAYDLGYKNGQFISNVERGLCSIPHSKVYKLSQVLNTPVVDIVDCIVGDERQNVHARVNFEVNQAITRASQIVRVHL